MITDLVPLDFISPSGTLCPTSDPFNFQVKLTSGGLASTRHEIKTLLSLVTPCVYDCWEEHVGITETKKCLSIILLLGFKNNIIVNGTGIRYQSEFLMVNDIYKWLNDHSNTK